MGSKRYPTNLSDAEWECLCSYLPAPSKRGRPRTHGSRAILDAIFYALKSGCPWRLLPHDFPPWKSVYDWFRKWRTDGTFERLNAACESDCGLVRVGSFKLARASATRSPQRLPALAVSSAATTEARRFRAESGTCW